jgi:hypothetical protein
MIGFINHTAPKFTSLEISKKSTSQKREKFILYSSGQSQSDFAKKTLTFFINMRKKGGDLFQKLENLFKLRLEIRFIDFLQLFLNIAIFTNIKHRSHLDYGNEIYLSGLTKKWCMHLILLVLLKIWDRLRSNLWVNHLILFFLYKRGFHTDGGTLLSLGSSGVNPL